MYPAHNNIVFIFPYVAPERSLIYSHENGNGILILNEKVADIKSTCTDAAIILAGYLNAKTKTFLDYIPHDDLDFTFVIRFTQETRLTWTEAPRTFRKITDLDCH